MLCNMYRSNLSITAGTGVTHVVRLFLLTLFILSDLQPFMSCIFTPLMSPLLNACFSNNACKSTALPVMDRPPPGGKFKAVSTRKDSRRDGCLCPQVRYDEAFNILTRQMSAKKVNSIPPISLRAIRGVN